MAGELLRDGLFNNYRTSLLTNIKYTNYRVSVSFQDRGMKAKTTVRMMWLARLEKKMETVRILAISLLYVVLPLSSVGFRRSACRYSPASTTRSIFSNPTNQSTRAVDGIECQVTWRTKDMIGGKKSTRSAPP